jgi:hypothetical protein
LGFGERSREREKEKEEAKDNAEALRTQRYAEGFIFRFEK